MPEQTREEVIKQFLEQRRKTTMAYYRYLNEPREYIPGITLHMRELDFLGAIAQAESPTVMELARILSVTHSAVSQTAARLIKKGLILRKKDGRDHRASIISLTKLGKTVVALDNELNALLDEELYKNISVFPTEYFTERIQGDKIMSETLDAYDVIMEKFMSELREG